MKSRIELTEFGPSIKDVVYGKHCTSLVYHQSEHLFKHEYVPCKTKFFINNLICERGSGRGNISFVVAYVGPLRGYTNSIQQAYYDPGSNHKVEYFCYLNRFTIKSLQDDIYFQVQEGLTPYLRPHCHVREIIINLYLSINQYPNEKHIYQMPFLTCPKYSKHNGHVCFTPLSEPRSDSRANEMQTILAIYKFKGGLSVMEGEVAVVTAGCPDWLFTCGDLSCISQLHVFDDVTHCPDVTDESVSAEACWVITDDVKQFGSRDICITCKAPSCFCADYLYQCSSGGCITWDKLCNGETDCLSLEDERCAQFSHSKSEFTSHQTADYSGKQFHCVLNNRFIPIEWVNDYVVDCFVGIVDILHIKLKLRKITLTQNYQQYTYYSEEEQESDEILLKNTELLQCNPTGTKTFNFSQLCVLEYDSKGEIKHCRSGAHLRNCKTVYSQGHYKCISTYSVGYSKVCDGVIHCPEGDDEDGCNKTDVLAC